MKSMKYKFIVVEGVDGSGKSTICNWISQNYDYKKYKSIGNPFANVKNHFSPDKVTIQERFSFLCGEAINNSFIIKENTIKNQHIIFDRYYYSTIVYCESLEPGITDEFDYLFNKLPKPDLVLFVDVNYKTMMNRLSNRDEITFIEQKFSEQDKFEILKRNYRKIIKSSNTMFIDNNSSLESSIEQIKSILE